MYFLYPLAKPFLFQLDAEAAHNLVVKMLRSFPLLFPEIKTPPALQQELFGHKVRSPVGLAAGFDKYGTLADVLPRLGFGFAELGSFTKAAQEGNPKPRMFRIPQSHAIVNKMGFNNPGIREGLLNLGRVLPRVPEDFALGISIGKSKETEPSRALDDYLEILAVLKERNVIADRAAYVAINVSSPNTPGLRDLQSGSYLSDLISGCKQAIGLPILVKFAPDFDSLSDLRDAVTQAAAAGVDGLILTNTTTNFDLVPDMPGEIRAAGGGLSGAPLREQASDYLREAYAVVGEDIPLVASGGIMTKQDVWRRILDGASLVQIYSGFIYAGPAFLAESLSYLADMLSGHGLVSMSDVVSQRAELRRMYT